MQIFGRAGRPQFDNEGEAFIICDLEKLNHFLALVTNQLPIESRFRDVKIFFFNCEDYSNASLSTERRFEQNSETLSSIL